MRNNRKGNEGELGLEVDNIPPGFNEGIGVHEKRSIIAAFCKPPWCERNILPWDCYLHAGRENSGPSITRGMSSYRHLCVDRDRITGWRAPRRHSSFRPKRTQKPCLSVGHVNASKILSVNIGTTEMHVLEFRDRTYSRAKQCVLHCSPWYRWSSFLD